jgi:predicted nucleic acid-binding OB-fold protein
MIRSIATKITVKLINKQIMENIENFNLVLLTMYKTMVSQEEQDAQKDDDVLYFDFETGRYEISYKDLKEQAQKELDKAIEDANNAKTV